LKTVNKIYFFLFFFYLPSSLFSQAYQFKNYSTDNGITQPYVYAINQDKNGYLWVGTGEGVCKFDGIKFKSFYSKDGLAENFIKCSYKDNFNNLWLGHNQGSVTRYDGTKFKSFNTSSFSKSPITCIVGDDKGAVWCATQNDGVFRIAKDFAVTIFKDEFNQANINSIAFTKNNQLLVATSEGLKLFSLEGNNRRPKYLTAISSIPETQINCIVKKNNSGSFWIGTEEEGVYLLTPTFGYKEPYRSTAIGKELDVALINVQDIYEDSHSNLWVATFGNGVVKLMLSSYSLEYNEFQHFSDDNGLGNKFIKTIYTDHEGNIWVGTYGTGLVEIADNYFAFYSHANAKFSNNVTSILISENTKWFGVENGLIQVDLSSAKYWQYYSKSNGFVDDKVTALFLRDTNHLIIGTDKNGVYELDISKNKFNKIALNADQLSNSINCISGEGNNLWIATKNGIFKIETDKRITTHYTTDNGLTHNNINQIYVDKNKVVWIATHSNYLTSIDGYGTIKNKKIFDGNDLITVTGITEDKERNLWVSTFGNGVLKIGKDSISAFTAANGLKSNYCYSIINDGSYNIWVGHRMGLSRIKTEKNIISQFDKADGVLGDCNYNAFYKDFVGNAWFGTTVGAIKFDPHKDKKNLIPPIINVISLKLNDKDFDFSKNIPLPYDDYRLRIDFVGISFKSNSNILYQYKLEGYDLRWSDKTNNTFAQYGKLTNGEYKFLLRAYNNDGVCNETPLTITISIAPPIWKRWWFIALMVIAVLYSFYLYIKIRERNHRTFQVKLQKALNQKTREVIIQKEEIEKKNKDITDSIKYAKRIQDAILPDWKKLKKIFPESFVFFQPRDIVSGDFYWFEKYDKKLIIACADATGHGVPGALMSMIGNTLLKDITSRPSITSPSLALAAMDNEIKVLLQQSADGDIAVNDADQTQDGVDTILCEIDTETYLVRICSTKRPVFVSINNELVLFKKETGEAQGYETRVIQLKKGDTIYMFTDGYPDQFGGEKGKKIKASNIKIMLDQIQSLPISKQEMIVDRYFNRWKEGHEQVDDVLFIGIKL
jgi:ligand-binding sensor domain-containing protein